MNFNDEIAAAIARDDAQWEARSRVSLPEAPRGSLARGVTAIQPSTVGGPDTPSSETGLPKHPFQILTRTASSVLQWGIYHDSHLYGSLRPDDDVSITGLLAADLSTGWVDLDAGDAIWIKVEFDAALDIVAVTVESVTNGDSFDLTAEAWTSNAYLEDDGGTPPVALYARLLIAYTGAADTTVRQVLKTDVMLRNLSVDGLAARYPFTHTGGYLL